VRERTVHQRRGSSCVSAVPAWQVLSDQRHNSVQQLSACHLSEPSRRNCLSAVPERRVPANRRAVGMRCLSSRSRAAQQWQLGLHRLRKRILPECNGSERVLAVPERKVHLGSSHFQLFRLRSWHFRQSNRADCFPCPAATFQDTPGTTTCLPCLKGQASSLTGRSVCLACAAVRALLFEILLWSLHRIAGNFQQQDRPAEVHSVSARLCAESKRTNIMHFVHVSIGHLP